jgi:hypothetical protein
MTVSKKVRNNAKNQFAKIKYDARKANMENIQIKAQRAETLQQLETEKPKYLLYFVLVVLTAITALLNYYKIKSKRAPASYLYDRNENR